MDSVWGQWYNLIFNTLIATFGQVWIVIAIFIIVAVLLGLVLGIDIRLNLIITSALALVILLSQGLFYGVLGFIVTIGLVFIFWVLLRRVIQTQ